MQTPPDTPHTLDRFSIRRAPLVFLLLLAGLGIRLYPVFQLDIEPRGDRELLVSLLADEWRSNWSYSLEGHPTAVMMPVYPVVVGLLRWVMPDSWTPLLVLQALLGTLAAWFVFRIAWRISRIPGVAWGTFFLCLFYPPLILLGLKIEPGMLYAFSLAFGIWLLSFTLVRTAPLAHILLAAFLFMGVIYVSPKILILIPFLAVWAGLKSYDRLTGMLGAFALCLACIVCLMPWMARNFISTGGFIPLTTGFVAPLQQSLADAGGPSVYAAANTPGQDESLRYHAGLNALFQQIRETTPRVWGRIFLRGFPFWITSYPGLLPGAGSGGPGGGAAGLESSLVYRGLFLSLTVSLLLLVLVGIAAAFFNLSAWMLLAVLFLATLSDVVMGNPAYDHLAVWPYFAIFISWGGWILVAWILAPALKARKDARQAPGSPSVTFEATPLPYGDLEPIRAPRLKPSEKSSPETDEEERIGPIF